MKKRFSAIVLIIVFVLSLAGCQPKQEEAPTCAINWRTDVTGKYLNDDNVRQLVTVQATSINDARIQLFVKVKENGKDIWNRVLCCDGFIGLNGLGKEKKGDNKTPIGDYEILTAFGIKENPGTALPYVDVTDDIYCCGDEEYYNQIIDIKDYPHECRGEHLIEYSPEYNYGFYYSYNIEGVYGVGSALFFHCMGAKDYTGGCIAVDEENMVTILKALEPGSRIVIDYIG